VNPLAAARKPFFGYPRAMLLKKRPVNVCHAECEAGGAWRCAAANKPPRVDGAIEARR
jgi:hypothetical protein